MIRNGGPFLSVLSFQNRSKLQLKALCSELFYIFFADYGDEAGLSE